MLELLYTKIRGQSRLFSFFTFNSYAYISYLDHPHVISSIANGQSQLSCMFLDVFYDHGFLLGRAPAQDYGFALYRYLEEVIFDPTLILLNHRERVPI